MLAVAAFAATTASGASATITATVRYQVGGHCRQSVEATIGRAIFNCEVAPFDIASVLEALSNSAEQSVIQLEAAEQADQCYTRLLSVRHERPPDRTTEECDELAPLHNSPLKGNRPLVSGLSYCETTNMSALVH
jgi:hypothetical protein